MPSILSLSLIYLNYPVPESRTISGLLSLSFSRPDQSTQVNRNGESEGGEFFPSVCALKRMFCFLSVFRSMIVVTPPFSRLRGQPPQPSFASTRFLFSPAPFRLCPLCLRSLPPYFYSTHSVYKHSPLSRPFSSPLRRLSVSVSAVCGDSFHSLSLFLFLSSSSFLVVVARCSSGEINSLRNTARSRSLRLCTFFLPLSSFDRGRETLKRNGRKFYEIYEDRKGRGARGSGFNPRSRDSSFRGS